MEGNKKKDDYNYWLFQIYLTIYLLTILCKVIDFVEFNGAINE